MCTGAIRMSQLGAVHFAAFDPSAGSTRLLDGNEFMREFPCVVHSPAHNELETVVVSLIVEYRYRTGHMRWLEHWRTYHSHGVAQGLKLFESGAHASWVVRSVSAQFIYEHVVSMLLS